MLSEDRKAAALDQQSDYKLEERLAAWRQEQHLIASQVIIKDDPHVHDEHHRFRCLSSTAHSSPCLYGGVDVSFPESDEDLAVAVYVVVDEATFQVVHCDHEYFSLEMPYVSSYLSFREIDPLERLVQKQLKEKPDLTPRAILVDGNGILHCRGAGIACFLGVRTGIPTIGVGKTLYCDGGLTKELVKRGIDLSLQALRSELNTDWQDSVKNQPNDVLLVDQRCIDVNTISSEDDSNTNMDRAMFARKLHGYCNGVAIKLRGGERIRAAALLGHGGRLTRGGRGTKNPIYISVGHNISLEEALLICAKLSVARIPEPVRQADLSGRRLLRANKTVDKAS